MTQAGSTCRILIARQRGSVRCPSCPGEESIMRARTSVGLLMTLAVLALSLVPAATLTARPADALSTCDRAQFIADVTVPDGTRFSPGAAFTKTWRLKNVGTCTWSTSYTLVFSSG